MPSFISILFTVRIVLMQGPEPKNHFKEAKLFLTLYRRGPGTLKPDQHLQVTEPGSEK